MTKSSNNESIAASNAYRKRRRSQ